jgi:hypothetical protein
MKKGLMLLLLACLVLPTAAQAGPPENVEGDFWYWLTDFCDKERWASDNQFLYGCPDAGVWEGSFNGDSTEIFDAVFYGAAEGGFLNGYEHAFYKSNLTFSGTVAGKTGTLEFSFIGTSPGPEYGWSGTWRILGGTEDLANLHGQGVIWSNDSGGVHYEGQIHFDP